MCYVFSLQKEIEFSDYILRGDRESAFRVLSTMYQSLPSASSASSIPWHVQDSFFWGIAISIKRVEDRLLTEKENEWLVSFAADKNLNNKILLLEERIEHNCRIAQTKRKNKEDMLVSRIMEYVWQNYQSPELGNDSIADVFCMNASYLSVFFKKKTNCSLCNFIQQVRLEKAKELLVSSNMNIDTIGKAVGYSGSIAFHKMFKKKTGFTPTMYRMYNICDQGSGVCRKH